MSHSTKLQKRFADLRGDVEAFKRSFETFLDSLACFEREVSCGTCDELLPELEAAPLEDDAVPVFVSQSNEDLVDLFDLSTSLEDFRMLGAESRMLGGESQTLEAVEEDQRETRIFEDALDGARPGDEGFTSCSSLMYSRHRMRLHDRWHHMYLANEDAIMEAEQNENVDKPRRAVVNNRNHLSLASFSSPGLLHPFSSGRISWDVIGTCFVVVDLFLLPVSLAWDFEMETGNFEYQFFTVTLVYWLLDIGLNFSTAYIDASGKLVSSRTRVVANYVFGWFMFDVFTVLIDCVMWLFLSTSVLSSIKGFRAFRMLRLVRVLRVLKVAHINNVIETLGSTQGQQASTLVLAFVRTMMGIFCLAHFLACLWYAVGKSEESNGNKNWLVLLDTREGILDEYLQSLAWILGHLTANSVDVSITPQAFSERVLMLVITLVSLIVLGCGIGKITETMLAIEKLKSESTRAKRVLERFMTANEVPLDLRVRIIGFVLHKIKHKSETSLEPNLQKLLSSSLSSELVVSQRLKHIIVYPLFHHIMQNQLRIMLHLCTAFDARDFAEDEHIFLHSTSADTFVITRHGTFSHDESNHSTYMESHPFVAFQRIHKSSRSNKSTWTSAGESVGVRSHKLSQGTQMTQKSLRSNAGDEGVRSQKLSLKSQPSQTSSMRSLLSSGSSTGDTEHECIEYSEPTFFAEYSLYAKTVHRSSLRALTTADILEISGHNFAEAIKDYPACIALIYKYAQTFIHNHEHMAYVKCEEVLSELLRAKHVWKSAAYILREETRLEDRGTRFQYLARVYDRSVNLDEITERLDWLFPEFGDNGTYHLFGETHELLRSKCAILSIIYIHFDAYETFTADQPFGKRLTSDQWAELQGIHEWIAIDKKHFCATLILLAIRGLGKVEAIVRSLPIHMRDPANAVTHLMRDMPQFVPSTTELERSMQVFISNILCINATFNMNQFLQGENIPSQLQDLKNLFKEIDDPNVFRCYVLVFLGVTCSLQGAKNFQSSLHMDTENATVVLLAIRCLEDFESQRPQELYWSYIKSRAKQFGMPASTIADYVLVRLACLIRAQPEDCAMLSLTWNRLSDLEKEELTRHFLADGIQTNAVIFSFLPTYLINAKENKHFGLIRGFSLLVELLENLKASGNMPMGAIKTACVSLQNIATIVLEFHNARDIDFLGAHISFIQHGTVLLAIVGAKMYRRLKDPTWQHAVDDKEIGYALRRLEKSAGAQGRLLSRLMQSTRSHEGIAQRQHDRKSSPRYSIGKTGGISAAKTNSSKLSVSHHVEFADDGHNRVVKESFIV